MRVIDLGQMPYRDAWARQQEEHARVREGAEERLLLVEHPPVITLGRRAEIEPQPMQYIVAPPARLAQLGIEVVPTDRGGDVTLHAPGQIVAYPILRLADHRLSVGAYVRRLEDVVISVLVRFGIEARKDDAAIGVWTGPPDAPAKICALGVRIRQGVSLHGIALNVDTDLEFFNLIVPCGLPGRGVASMRTILKDACPPIERVKQLLADEFCGVFRQPSFKEPLTKVLSS